MRSDFRRAMSCANMTERNMTAICIKACLLTVAAIWSAHALSHHSSASLYDITTIAQWEGVVTEYEMINPHAYSYRSDRRRRQRRAMAGGRRCCSGPAAARMDGRGGSAGRPHKHHRASGTRWRNDHRLAVDPAARRPRDLRWQRRTRGTAAAPAGA